MATMSNADGDMIARFKAMPESDRKKLQRAMTGEADKDLLARGDVLDALRQLVTSDWSTKNIGYQKGVLAAIRAVHDLRPAPNTKLRCRPSASTMPFCPTSPRLFSAKDRRCSIDCGNSAFARPSANRPSATKPAADAPPPAQA